VSDKPPPFNGYTPVLSEDVWAKILAGQVKPHIYSGEAKGDLEPVPISAAEFFMAEEASRNEDGHRDALAKPYQIMWRDRDRRRPSGTRRAVPVPHWVYLQADQPAAQKQPSGPGAAEQYDWDDIEQFIRREFGQRGDFAAPENKGKGWRSQNDLIELIKDYLQRRSEKIPGPSRFKTKVGEILATIRSELLAGH
jgi:hypothetical protein